MCSKYLPEPLSEDEVSAIIDAAIADAAQAVGQEWLRWVRSCSR